MACDELLRLLQVRSLKEQQKRKSRTAMAGIVAHIRSCPRCHHGVVRLSTALIARSPLTCDQCRARFPAYYEATRPEYPLVELSEVEMTEIAVHLSRCSSCHNIYEELVLLAELEERDEMIGP